MNIQQDKGVTHIPGHENHVCNKCGWSYPNPHPSAKNRRAHKKVCGSMNGSYDNIVFDDGTKKSGLVVSAPSNLVADKTEKGIDGIREGLDKSKSEDGVFSAPVANTSESGLSPGVKEPLKQDSLDSGTTVEQIGIKAHEVSLSSNNSGFVNVGSADFLSLRAKDDIPLELNSVEITNASTNGFQVESTHVKQFSTSSDVNILQEKGEVNGNVGTPPTHDVSPKVAHPQSEYEGFKDPEGVVSLKCEDASNSVTEENTYVFNQIHLSEKNVILSPEVHVVSSTDSTKEPVKFDNIETKAEKNTEVSSDKLKVESFDRLEANGGSVKAIETETNESHIIPFTEEQKTVHSSKDSQQISLPEASSIENPRDATFASETSETIGVIGIHNASHNEKNRTEINDIVVDGNNVIANVENGIETKTKDLQPSNLLQFEAKHSRDLVKSDDVGESGKIEKRDITETAVISEAVVDGATKKAKALECTNGSPILAAREDEKEDEIISNIKAHEEYSRSIDPSGDSHHTQNAELLVKPVENLAAKYTPLSLNSETSTQHDSAAEDNKDGEQGGKVSGITYVPVQDRSVNNSVKHSETSIDSSSRCDSLEGNQGSVSVISLQSDAPAVIDTKTLPSTGLLASTEAGKSNVNSPEESFHKPQTGHMFNPKAAASEVKKGSSPQQPDSTLTQVIINESSGKKKNEEIIAKVTKVRSSLKSLLEEDAESEKANSSTFGGHSSNQENGKFPEHNSSGLKTVNSILGPESPAAQAEKRETTKECKSPARYPAGTKKEKGKPKTRPLWIQLVCCSYEPSRR